MRRLYTFLFLTIFLIQACANTPPPTEQVIQNQQQVANLDPIATYLPPTRDPAAPEWTPTPDMGDFVNYYPTFTPFPDIRAANGAVQTPEPKKVTYTVEENDIWGSIADKLNVSVDDLLAANNASEYDIIYPGDELQVPERSIAPLADNGIPASIDPAGEVLPYFKIIPDSELVYGPLSAKFEITSFIQQKGGYLSTFSQDVEGRTLSGAQIIEEVSRSYSVNPRLLLSILEYRSGWVTNPSPPDLNEDMPIGYFDDYHLGLYRQLMFTSSLLNEGFYGWRNKQLVNIYTVDGHIFTPSLGSNAGTVGVFNLFAFFDEAGEWKVDTSQTGLSSSYNALFGSPWDLRVEPLLPTSYMQPTFSLPFKPAEEWHFTGGPHAGWDKGSAWAAIDFAPPGDPLGCQTSEYWTTAVAPGLVVRSDNGSVVVDLDGDGFEQTGWSVLYLHMASEGRVAVGTSLNQGDLIGHPSCEGGESLASHLHLARKFNGVWISATDPLAPFVLGGYQVISDGEEYNGFLRAGDKSIEAQDGYLDENLISY